MDPPEPIKKIAEVALQGLEDDFIRNPLSLMTEGHTRVVVAEALLNAGMSIVECKPGQGGRGYELRFDGEKLTPIETEHPVMQGGRPDLRVLAYQDAEPVFVELKTRFTFGSQGSAASSTIDKDFAHIRTGSAQLFLLAASLKIYHKLSTDKFMCRMPIIRPLGFEPQGWAPIAGHLMTARYTTLSAFGHSAVFLAVASLD